jgi:hypothetical protein
MQWDLSNPVYWRAFFGPALLPREMRTLQKDISARAHGGDPAKLFYDGLEKLAEDCTWSVLEDIRNVGLTENTTRAYSLLDPIRNFFGDGGLTKLEQFYEAPTDASDNSQAKLCKALSAEHATALIKKLSGRRVPQDFISHIFCLPMADNFGDEVELLLQRTSLWELPKEWDYAIVAKAAQKKVPYVCGIWIYVAAVRTPKSEFGGT